MWVMGRKNQGMKIEDLPDDDTDEEIDSEQLRTLNNILNVKEVNPEEYNKLKFIMFASGIFFVLSLPFTERLLELALPAAGSSWLVLLGLKTVLFFIIYYVVFYMQRSF